MNMEGTLAEKSSELFLPFCDKTVTHDTATEIIIPDHQPEARKLLSVTPRILPPAKYVNGSAVELSGGIDYTALYVGMDGEVYSAIGSGEYECSAPAEKKDWTEPTDAAQVIADSVCESINGRISSGRRISVKCRLASRIRAYGSYGGVEDSQNTDAQILYGSAKNVKVYSMSSEPVELTGEITGVAQDMRVVSADGKVTVKEIKCSSEGAEASGDVVVELIGSREGQPLCLMTAKIPFTAEMDSDNEEDGFFTCAWGELTDISVTVDEGSIKLNVIAVIHGEAAKNTECHYTRDAYFLDRRSECKTETVDLPMLKVCSMGSFSWSERIPLNDTSVREGANIIRVKCAPRFTDCRYADGKYTLSGQSKYNLLCEKDGEYFISELDCPVKYEISGEHGDDVTCWDATAREISCKGRVEGETLCIDSEIGVCAFISSTEKIQVLTDMIEGEPIEKKGCRMIVYFPADKESRWEVAKKYHVPTSTLTEESRYYLF
jgi:hypothetical protein